MIGFDRIVEISVLKVMPDGSTHSLTQRINPQIPIPYEVSLIHGIYDEDIKDSPSFSAFASELAEFLTDCDLAGYNSNKFDIPLLMEEFMNTETPFDLNNRYFVDVQNIFHQMEQRTLKAAYKFYCGKDLENAHSAEADTTATYEVLLSQLERYENTEWTDKKGNVSVPVVNDVEKLHTFTNLNRSVDFAGRLVFNDAGVEVFNFGKHKGRPVEDVFDMEPTYYSWMQQGDFPKYTKSCLTIIWNRWTEKKGIRKSQSHGTQTTQAIQSNKRPEKKPEEPATPVTNDMLAMLKNKFTK